MPEIRLSSSENTKRVREFVTKFVAEMTEKERLEAEKAQAASDRSTLPTSQQTDEGAASSDKASVAPQ